MTVPGLDLYRAAFDFTPIGMAFVSPQRQVISVNPALVALLGRSQEELRRIGIAGLTHPDDVDLHVDLHARLAAGEIDSYSFEKRYIHKDGHPIECSLHVAAVRNAYGELMYLISQVVDISARVQTRPRPETQQGSN